MNIRMIQFRQWSVCVLACALIGCGNQRHFEPPAVSDVDIQKQVADMQKDPNVPPEVQKQLIQMQNDSKLTPGMKEMMIVGMKKQIASSGRSTSP